MRGDARARAGFVLECGAVAEGLIAQTRQRQCTMAGLFQPWPLSTLDRLCALCLKPKDYAGFAFSAGVLLKEAIDVRDF